MMIFNIVDVMRSSGKALVGTTADSASEKNSDRINESCNFY